MPHPLVLTLQHGLCTTVQSQQPQLAVKILLGKNQALAQSMLMNVSLDHGCLKFKSGLISPLNSLITAISKSAIDIHEYGDIYNIYSFVAVVFLFCGVSPVKKEESNRLLFLLRFILNQEEAEKIVFSQNKKANSRCQEAVVVTSSTRMATRGGHSLTQKSSCPTVSYHWKH